MSEDALQGTEAQALADLSSGIASLLEEARRQAARSVNAILTATYWEVGRRIVEFEQGGAARAGYGQRLIVRLSADLSAKFGRGFSERNLEQMRQFYLARPIPQTVSAESLTLPDPHESNYLNVLGSQFSLSWSHYVRLLSLQNEQARRFYEAEALRGGWSLRQLERQINSMFYERTALSKNKVAMLTKHAATKPEDAMTASRQTFPQQAQTIRMVASFSAVSLKATVPLSYFLWNFDPSDLSTGGETACWFCQTTVSNDYIKECGPKETSRA